MAAPCTEHLFLTGRKGVGKSTLLRAVLEGKRLGGFFTRRITGIFERPSIHLLRAAESQQPSPENLVCLCGERRTDLFDRLGPAALADAADCDVIVMDELGPSEAAALEFQKAVLAEEGCLQYQYFEAVDEPDKLLLVERWTERKAQEVHMTRPHMVPLTVSYTHLTLPTIYSV